MSTSVPGAAKAPEALREAGLYTRFAAAGAIDAGIVLAGRYVDDADPSSGRVRNQDGLVDYSRRLAARLDRILDAGDIPLVIGGDCSILIGTGLMLARRGRYGLAHVDGHTDFRHPGNSDECASVAGEDLAAAIGRHWPGIADIDGLGPYFGAADVVHMGCRDGDENLVEARSSLGAVVPARELRAADLTSALNPVRAVITAPELEGYWLHIDVDVLDPAYMPAVDSPDPGGLNPEQFVTLLSALAPGACGAQVTVFDPDLDPDGTCALLLAEMLLAGLSSLGSSRRSQAI